MLFHSLLLLLTNNKQKRGEAINYLLSSLCHAGNDGFFWNDCDIRFRQQTYRAALAFMME